MNSYCDDNVLSLGMNLSTTPESAIPRQSLTSAVADKLREEIIRGARPEGAQLRQDAIAMQYQVSRIPVREALRQLDAEVATQNAQDDVRVTAARVLSRDLPGEARGLDTSAGLPGIEQHVFDRQSGLVVAQGFGPVQRAEREISRAELMLGEQRAEHEDRVVTALVALGELHSRQVSRAGLANPRICFFFSGIRGGH